MRLESFQVNYFRSIKNSEPILLNQKTIIVGKNNEGKSNYLKALNIALSILLDRRRVEFFIRRKRFLSDDSIFNWERDYPVNLQNKKKQPNTKFFLTFNLTNDDIENIKSLINIELKSNLIIEIEINKDDISLNIYHIPKNIRKKLKEPQIDKVCEYITKEINFTYIPAIRTEKASLNIIESLISKKLDTLEEDEDYNKAKDIIKSKQSELLVKLSHELVDKLHTFVPELKDVQLSAEYESRHSYGSRSDYKFIVDDGSPTEISYKGDGFKSLVTLALLHDKGQSNKSNIIAIEEPEAHLHSGAIHKLKNILEDIYNNNQIILTTHNQVFIDREVISNNIIVDDGKIKKVKDIKQLRNILGVELSDNLTSCERILLVEGSTDAKLLLNLLPLLNPEIKDKIKKGQLIITSVGGAKYLIQYVNFYKNVLCDVIILTDCDKEGHDVQDKIISEHILETKSMFFVDNVNYPNKNSELENIIKPNYVEHFMLNHLPEFNIVEYQKSKLKWSDEIKKQYQQNGHSFNEEVEAKLKEDFVDFILEGNLIEKIKDSNIRIFTNLVNKLCE